MAEEQSKDSVLGGLRSRLPKFFSEGAAPDETPVPVATPPVPAAKRAAANAQTIMAPMPASMTVVPAAVTPPPAPASIAPVAVPPIGEVNGTHGGEILDTELSVEASHLQHLQYLVEEFGQVQTEMQRMYQLVEEIAERESAQEKVFNTLHAELRDYKNDFIYEHLKPVIRPLLFLYDSLEQFDAEIALYERPNTGERRQVGLSPQLVRENISFFRDQLIESLRICEVAPMEAPKGAFNARLHKVIDVVPADDAQDGMIQRVVRSGWYLNGQLLRSAEVIVGKKMS